MSGLPFYASNLLPAAAVPHGYRNCWGRDNYYIGLCSCQEDRDRIWDGNVAVLDKYKWKLEHHAKKRPDHWYEHIHIRYSPEGNEIAEGWMHHQWDTIGNYIDMCIDKGRLDLVSYLVDYLNIVEYHKSPAAGMWEDRNEIDAYSIAACLHALQRSKRLLPEKRKLIEGMVDDGVQKLYSILPYATKKEMVCLSLLGVIWPYNLAGPYREDIIELVMTHLKREPFGFIRYEGDSYDGEFMSRAKGSEVPWLLGDLFMALIEPDNRVWKKRIKAAHGHFGMMPEAYFPESMKPNRNSPLLWADAMFNLIFGIKW